MFIESADPDLVGVRTHNFLDWSYRLAVLAKGAFGCPGVPRGVPPRAPRGVRGSENMFIGSADPDLGVVRTHNFFDPSKRSRDRHVWGQFTMSEGSSPCQGTVHLGRRDLKVCSSNPPAPI